MTKAANQSMLRAADEAACGEPSRASLVSVAIPTWQRAPWLARCLRAVLAQEVGPAEVIVVGRAEDREARALTERMGALTTVRVRWVEVDRPGHVAPVAKGLEEACGEIIVFLDDDTEPQPRWLAALLQPFTDPQVVCVGGQAAEPGFHGVVRRDSGRVRWYGKHIGNVAARTDPGLVELHGVMEANWGWRRSVLTELEFDPVFDYHDACMYGLDLCLQARSLGYRVMYESSARVIHYVASRDPALDRGDRVRRTYSYSRNYTYLGLKHFRGLRRWAFLVWWWGLGERGSYGMCKGLVDLAFKGIRIWPEITASFRGKCAGVQAWLSR